MDLHIIDLFIEEWYIGFDFLTVSYEKETYDDSLVAFQVGWKHLYLELFGFVLISYRAII